MFTRLNIRQLANACSISPMLSLNIFTLSLKMYPHENIETELKLPNMRLL